MTGATSTLGDATMADPCVFGRRERPIRAPLRWLLGANSARALHQA
jgi:hypothetical protein